MLTSVDTKNGTSPQAKELNVGRAQAFVLFLAPHGAELDRLTNPKSLLPITQAMTRVAASSRTPSELDRYVQTYRRVDAAMRRQVAALAEGLGSPDAQRRFIAARKLVELGEPAYRVLGALEPGDADARRRVRAVLGELEPMHLIVAREGLHRDVAYLARRGDAGRARLERILPPGVMRRDIVSWWAQLGHEFRWDPTQDRYVRWDAWPTRPLRFSRKANVELAKSENLIDLDGDFTIELWVHWPVLGKSVQYLAADEMWPGMSGHVRTDRERGWVLRRYTEAHQQRGYGRLQFTVGAEPRGWKGVQSELMPVSSGWEHIAVTKAAGTLRLFRNGELVAETKVRERLVPSPSKVYLGVRKHAWNDRNADQAVRGFRISNIARYRTDFFPPQQFTTDKNTLVVLDFAGGALRDLSGHARHGTLNGPHWANE